MTLFSRVESRQPKHLADIGDAVLWDAVDKKGNHKGEWKYTDCYGTIMSNPGYYEITCRPYPKPKMGRFRNRLTKTEYAQITDLFKEVGLIPDEVKCFTNWRGNMMVIPRKNWDRHTVYIALCLYRYMDSKPRTFRAALQIWRQTKLPWLQVFHYAMAHRGVGVGAGHGFTGFATGHNYGGGGGLNPATSMALCRFGATGLAARRREIPKKNPGFTYTFLQEIQNKLNPTTKKKERWSMVDVPALQFRNLEQILDPHFSPLFTDPTIDAQGLREIMESAPPAKEKI